MNKTGKRLLKSALIGWLVAFLGSSILIGGDDTIFDGQFLLFLSLAPGAIAGIIVSQILNKSNESFKMVQSKTPESRLMDLKNLLEQGVINQEEFEEQKKKILNS